MTLNTESPHVILKGNGTATGYSFTFTVDDIKQLVVLFTPESGVRFQLSTNDFTFTKNAGTSGGSITFLKHKPTIKETIEIWRSTEISQEIDFNVKKQVTYQDTEYALDKLTKISQELHDLYISSKFIQSIIPNPHGQMIGRFPMTDGHNGYVFSPVFQQSAGKSDANKSLIMDNEGKNIILVPMPGASNPTIPQASQERREVVTESGVYKLGYTKPTFTAQDVKKIELWDGNKFIKSDGTGASNPTIPHAGLDGSVLTYVAGRGYVLLDNSHLQVSYSSGVISGFEITKASANTVDITPGIALAVENVVDNPKTQRKQFYGIKGVKVPTDVGNTHFLYLHTDNMSISVDTQYHSLARGNIILLAEIEHTYNNEITYITADYNLLPAPAAQLHQILHEHDNKVTGVVVEKLGANQLKYSSGAFTGLNVNANTDKLSAHQIKIASKTPATFKFRGGDGEDSAPDDTIDFDNLLLDDGKGNLTNVKDNFYVYVPVWLYPSGDLVMQYPTLEYGNKTSVPPIGEFLVKLQRNELLTRNAALIAVMLLQKGADFDSGSKITPIVGGVIGGSSGTALPELPPLNKLTDDNKLIIANDGNWEKSTFKLTPPQKGDEGKMLVIDNDLDFAIKKIDKSDPIARTVVNNSVISGMKLTVDPTAKSSVSFTAGEIIYMDDAEGEPKNLVLQQMPAIPKMDLVDISTKDYTYVYFKRGETSPKQTYTPGNWVRGDSLLFCRLNHSNRKEIEDVVYLYNTATSVVNQMHSLYKLAGNKVLNIDIRSEGLNSLSHLGGTFFGYNANVNNNKNDPHQRALPSLNPIPLEFRISTGSSSVPSTTIPANPKVELTPGTATDLPDGEFGYYPVWLFPHNFAVIQCATVTYKGKPPEAADFLLTFKEDPITRQSAALVGLILWEGGKDFNSGCKFLNIARGVASSASGGSPLPPATSRDAGRAYTVGEHGTPELGVKIEQPLSGGDPTKLANKQLMYNKAGTEIIASTPPPSIPWAPGAKKNGDYLLVSRSGALDTLTNRGDYVKPNIYTVNGMQYFNAYRWLSKLTKVGFLLNGSELTLAADHTVLTGSDASNKIETEPGGNRWSANPTGNPRLDNNFEDMCERFYPPGVTSFNPSKKGTKYVTGDIAEFVVNELNPGGKFLPVGEGKYTLKSPNLSAADLKKITEEDTTIPLKLKVTYGGKKGKGLQYFYNIEGEALRAQFYPLDGGKEVIPMQYSSAFYEVEIWFTNPAPLLMKNNVSFRIWCNSQANVLRQTTWDIQVPTDGTKVKTSLDTKYLANGAVFYDEKYHCNKKDKYFFVDDNYIFGCQVMPTAFGMETSTEEPETTVECNFLFKYKPRNGYHLRFVYVSLASLNTVAASNDVFAGEAPDLKPGKITLFYQVQAPEPLPIQDSEYQGHLKSVMPSPFEPGLLPIICLGDNEWYGKPFIPRKISTPLLAVYDIECTPEEFTNNKIEVRTRWVEPDKSSKSVNPSLDYTKTLFDKYKITLWAVNTEDLPE